MRAAAFRVGLIAAGHTKEANMNKSLIALTATASLAMSSVHAADLRFSVPPQTYGAAHLKGRIAISVRPPAVRPAAMAHPVSADAAPNAHVIQWRSFDVPAGSWTQPTGINDLGEIVGVYGDSKGNIHGFVRELSGAIITFDAPNRVGTTFPNDINNQGDIVGSYSDANGATHGFIRSARGKFTTIDDSSSTSSPPATVAQALNDWGEVVGYWLDSSFNPHGFVRHLDGSLTTVDPPGDVLSQCYHINDRGEVGGDWSDAATGTFHGMLLQPDGKALTFEAPNAIFTFGGLGQALNLEGSFAGTYADANGGLHGYVRSANGKFAEFTAPGAGTSNFNGTWSTSVNLLGTVVGFSSEQNGAVDGYVRFADGSLVLANAPVVDQQSTFAWSINDLNEITGFWFDSQGAQHGFIALAVP